MYSPEVLRITVEPVEDARLIRAAGELDMSTAAALERELAAARNEGVTALLDLSDLTFIDSTGLHLLLKASRSAGRADWSFFIVRPSDAVRRLIDLTCTAELLALAEPVAERGLV